MNHQECIKEWMMGDCLNSKFDWSIHNIRLMNEGKNEWMNEWMNKWMNKWIGERKDEWMNKWMNIWMNEWINTSEDNKPSSQDSLCYFLTQRFHPISHQAHTQNLHSSGVLLGI